MNFLLNLLAGLGDAICCFGDYILTASILHIEWYWQLNFIFCVLLAMTRRSEFVIFNVSTLATIWIWSKRAYFRFYFVDTGLEGDVGERGS